MFVCVNVFYKDVKPDMRIMREEIFGPVVVICKFKDTKDVIKQANDTIFGLAASVFTSNITRAVTVSNALEAGSVCEYQNVNAIIISII